MKKLYAILILLFIGFQGFANVLVPVVPTEKSSLECATLTQTSSVGTSMQTVCIGTPIMVISYLVANGGTGASVTGLPPGVTSGFSTGTLSIFGTPTAPGVYNYTVTTIGGYCASSLSGVITVNPNASLSLSSPASTSNQTVCLNTPIDPVTYMVGNGATSATVTGLPSGVSSNFNSATQTLTLSGAPSATGTYSYMVTTSGGCGASTLGGTLTVQPNAVMNLTSVVTGNSITFDWAQVPGASGYLYYYSVNGGAIITGIISFPDVTEFSVPNLTENSTVWFNVAAQGICTAGTATVSNTLGTKTFDEVRFKAYPNPVTDLLHLQGDRTFLQVQVFDTLGKLMSESHVQSENPAIDLSALAPGIYLVKATAHEAQQTFSVIKK